MPIYEYQATGDIHCDLCKDRFEVKQRIDDAPLQRCPRCGAEVKRLVSLPFLCLKQSPSSEETLATYPEGEADELGSEEGFDEDEIWD